MNEVLAYLVRRKPRTLLTLFAVSVGTFALVIGGSLSEFMNHLITSGQNGGLLPIPVSPADPQAPLSERTLHQLRRVPGVLGLLQLSRGPLDPDDRSFSLVGPEEFVGTTSDLPNMEYFFLSFDAPGTQLLEGRFPAPGSRQEAVAGYEIAQKHGWQVGQTISFRDRDFMIVGLWERAPNYPANFVQISYDAARRLTAEPENIGSVAVVLAPGADEGEVIRRIMDQVDGVRLRSLDERVQEARRTMAVYNLILVAIVALSVLVGGSTIVNTMMAAVAERTREIGLKKALGATDGDVLAEFVFEAGVIGGLGGGLSVLAAGSATSLINIVLQAELGMGLFRLTPRLAVGAVVFTVMLGMLAGIYPALHAARLDPVKTLRGIVEADVGRRRWPGRVLHALRSESRGLLTVSGIALGVFALVVIGSLSEYLLGMIAAAEAGAADRIGVIPAQGSSLSTASIRRVVEPMPGVRGVIIGSGNAGGPLQEVEGINVFGTFYGIDSPTGELDFNMPFEVRLWKGRFLAPGSAGEAVVGFDLAERYGLDLGAPLTIRDRDFTVVGVYERGAFGFLAGQFNQQAFISMDAFNRLLERPRGSGGFVTVLMAPGQDAEIVADRIKAQLPGVDTLTARQAGQDLRQIFMLFILLLSASGALALIVGGLSVVNTMLMAVSERTREIGLKKALGASEADILSEVVTDSGLMGGLGGLMGLALGWGLVQWVNTIAAQLENIHILNLTPRLMAAAIVSTVLIGMMAGLIPAWNASRLDPVRSLRAD